MSNPNINIEILAEPNDELVNGHPVISGKIVLNPRETITIDSMNVYLSYEVKGKMSPIKNLMGVQNLFSYSKQLSRDQRYEFPFSFVVSDGIYSFTGKNAALHHKLEVGMDIHPEDYNKVKPGVFSSLRKMVTNDTSIRSHRYIYFENVTKNYQVETSEVTLQRNFIYWLAFVLSVVFAAIGLFFIIPEMSQLYVIVTIVSSLLLGFLSQLVYLQLSQTEVVIQLSNHREGGFTIKSIANSGAPRKDLEFHYEVCEKVTDQSGTTSYEYVTVLYKSEMQMMRTGIVEKDLHFEFPPNKSIPTITLTNFEVIWTIYAERKDSFGLPAIYEADVNVWLE